MTDLRNTAQARGFWCTTGHPAVVDAAASVHPDFVCIDTQHGAPLPSIDASTFTVLAHYGVAGLVRVEANEIAPIGRALDLGADGIVVPLVDTARDAAAAVAATRHAPRGSRSFGMQTRRVGPFDTAPYVVIQIETAAAIDQVDEIAGTDGVDCVYIGPADLGLALGGVPASDVNTVLDGTAPNATQMKDAFQAVIDAGKRHGIASGVHCADGATARRAFEMGFTFIAFAADVGLISKGLALELEAVDNG